MNQNFDLNELKKFDQQATSWWDKSGPMKSLHDINPLRLAFIQEKLGPIKNTEILDVGCGGGILTESLSMLGAKVTGIDANQSLIDAAKTHAMQSSLQIDYVNTTAEAYSQNGKTFDVITCMELLEHIPKPETLIKALSSLLKPGGKIFFSTINRTPAAFLKALVIAEHVLKLLPKGTHEYKKLIKPSELQAWCFEADITLTSLQGMSYHPLTKDYYLTNDIKVNYLAYGERNPL